jgi:hypothetical protein
VFKLFSVVAIAALAGCAAPVLSDSSYDGIAGSEVAIRECTRAGYMSPEVGAVGLRATSAMLAKHAYYPGKLELARQKMIDEIGTPTSRQCNDLALSIQTAKGSTGSSVQSTQSSTSCSTSFGQTYCQTIKY